MPRIVTLNVSVDVAPTPNNLQQTGAIISQGATTLSSGAYSLLTQSSDLTSLLGGTLSLTSITWSSGTATATAAAAIPGLSINDVFITTIAGATPAGYNGTFLATVTGTNTFTFALASNPGTETVAGTFTPPNQQELIAMVGEFFSQGQTQAVYVLELGAGDGTSGPTALSTWITANPGVFYSYLLPRLWDATSQSSPTITLMKAYTSTTSMTYFFVTTTTANYAQYTGTNALKSAVPFVEAPLANATLNTFDCASVFQMWLSNNPGVGTPMTTMSWRYSFGTTAWPQAGNTATLASMDAAKVNYITTGAQGGISTNCLANGYTGDGRPMAWWYEVDYLQIQIPIMLANAVINASNDGNPIDYDQSGVDTLHDVSKNVFTSAAAANVVNGPVTGTDLTQTQFTTNFNNGDYNGQNVVNAVPFQTYVAANQSQYLAQKYGGFSAVATPMLGIESIIFNLTATTFA